MKIKHVSVTQQVTATATEGVEAVPGFWGEQQEFSSKITEGLPVMIIRIIIKERPYIDTQVKALQLLIHVT